MQSKCKFCGRSFTKNTGNQVFCRTICGDAFVNWNSIRQYRLNDKTLVKTVNGEMLPIKLAFTKLCYLYGIMPTDKLKKKYTEEK